ncbi:MFS transporter [Rhodococcus hoagii]|nr:MFS transporter [Prescottella equi]
MRAAIVGTVVEYYDFGIYGYMATIIASLFFVSENDTAALLGTFADVRGRVLPACARWHLLRPIGDKYGRKNALSWTILLSVATAAMGMMPTYVTLGVWATAILVLAVACRLRCRWRAGWRQRFVSESAPARWRAFPTSMVNSGNLHRFAGGIADALALTSVFTHDQIMSWAWRIPFLLSVVIGVVGIWIRNHMEDTPQFKELEDKGETAKVRSRNCSAAPVRRW